MSLIETKSGRIVIKKAESLMMVPYVYDRAIGDLVLGNDVYDISPIIGDTITLEQSEGDKTTKMNEFVGEPLLECYSNSTYSFSAQCIDFQDSILRTLFSAIDTTETGQKILAMTSEYKDVEVLVMVGFGGDVPNVVIPKVKLNSRIAIQQLKTSSSVGKMVGTAYSIKVGVKISAGVLHNFSLANGTTSYTPLVPVVFVPKNTNFLAYSYTDRNDSVYSSVDFGLGTVRRHVVDESRGTFRNLS